MDNAVTASTAIGRRVRARRFVAGSMLAISALVAGSALAVAPAAPATAATTTFYIFNDLNIPIRVMHKSAVSDHTWKFAYPARNDVIQPKHWVTVDPVFWLGADNHVNIQFQTIPPIGGGGGDWVSITLVPGWLSWEPTISCDTFSMDWERSLPSVHCNSFVTSQWAHVRIKPGYPGY